MLMRIAIVFYVLFYFFNDTATTEIYTLSLHDALPILACTVIKTHLSMARPIRLTPAGEILMRGAATLIILPRSEEHTSELQSHVNLVCRLLLEKKKKKKN